MGEFIINLSGIAALCGIIWFWVELFRTEPNENEPSERTED